MTIRLTAWNVVHSPELARGRWIPSRSRLRSAPSAMRDRALFWLIYDGGLRCQEALAINLHDIDWAERSIRIHGKGDRGREMFFSRRVLRYLDDYL